MKRTIQELRELVEALANERQHGEELIRTQNAKNDLTMHHQHKVQNILTALEKRYEAQQQPTKQHDH